MRNSKRNRLASLSQIWSQEFWDRCAERLEEGYAKLLRQAGIPRGRVNGLYSIPTEHRIEAAVRRVAKKLDDGNVHLGLTSSDLEDNIRIYRLNLSIRHLSMAVSNLARQITAKFLLCHDEIPAYTHLLPAGKIEICERFFPTTLILAGLSNELSSLTLHYKGIGGSLGTRHVQYKIGIDDAALGQLLRDTFEIPTLRTHEQMFSSQTVDHGDELYFGQILQKLAMVLRKLSWDMRMMIALGDAYSIRKDIASSALAGKKQPNPWRLERIHGMSDILIELPAKIARIGGDCILERTLNNQSALNYLEKEAIYTAMQMLLDMAESLDDFTLEPRLGKELPDLAEEQVVDLVKSGKYNRLEAYKMFNKNLS